MPYPYTAHEYAIMHYIYEEYRGNGVVATNLYRESYSNTLRHPDHRLFINVHRAYAEGKMPRNRARIGRPRMDYDEKVLQGIENDQTISAREIESSTNPVQFCRRMLQKHRFWFHQILSSTGVA